MCVTGELSSRSFAPLFTSRFQRPLWITEFADAEGNATTNLAFMQEVMPALQVIMAGRCVFVPVPVALLTVLHVALGR